MANNTALDLNELKSAIEAGGNVYQEVSNNFDVNGMKAEINVSVVVDKNEPDYVHIRTSGNIPLSVDGGEPVFAPLDREIEMTKDDFLALDADGLRGKIQETFTRGRPLTQDEVEKRTTDKAFSMFEEIGGKFDEMLRQSKDTISKYLDGMKSTVDAAKENASRAKDGKDFMKASDYVKSAQDRVVGIGKNIGRTVKDSYNRANAAFDAAMREQTKKNNDVFHGVKGTQAHMEQTEKSVAELTAEIDSLTNGLKAELEVAKANGALEDPAAMEKIEGTWNAIQDKMKECINLREELDNDKKVLEELKAQDIGGKDFVSPNEAANKAMRDSYFKDLSATYDTAKQAVMSAYEAGKTAIIGMTNTVKDANEHYKNVGRNAYRQMVPTLNEIGRVGLSVMQSMEMKVAVHLRDKAKAMTDKYQYRAEVRASVKNVFNAIRKKEEREEPALTKKELANIDRLNKWADNLEARAGKTAEKIKEATMEKEPPIEVNLYNLGDKVVITIEDIGKDPAKDKANRDKVMDSMKEFGLDAVFFSGGSGSPYAFNAIPVNKMNDALHKLQAIPNVTISISSPEKLRERVAKDIESRNSGKAPEKEAERDVKAWTPPAQEKEKTVSKDVDEPSR